ncbi:MAG: DUF202 domain-containing protein [Pseudonocardiaceae bacterium]|nr:DUF202 domain-containing protein [Pseudonocardiaceae bacterium]
MAPDAEGPRSRWRRLPPLRQVGSDPDYRFTLANERTLLAWLRTALGLVAGAVALAGLLPEFGPQPVRIGLAVVLLALALLAVAAVLLAVGVLVARLLRRVR